MTFRHHPSFDEAALRKFGPYPDVALPLIQLDVVLLNHLSSNSAENLPIDRISADTIVVRIRYFRDGCLSFLLVTVRETENYIEKLSIAAVQIPSSHAA